MLLDEEEDDDDDDDDNEDDDVEEGGGVGMAEEEDVVEDGAAASRGSEVSAGALARVREDTDGRRRRLAGWEGGAGAERVGTGRAAVRGPADGPTDLRFDGDRANVGAGAGTGACA